MNARLLLLPLLVAAIAACSPPIQIKRLSPEEAQREQTANVLSTGRASDFSMIELRRYDLLARFDKNPADALAKLHERVVAGTARSEELYALSELSYLHAQEGGGRAHYLAAAVYAYALIFREVDDGDTLSDLDPRTRWAAEIYNRALAEAFQEADEMALAYQAGTYALPFGSLTITVDDSLLRRSGAWRIVDLTPTSDVSVVGLRNRYRRVGIGTPLVGRVEIVDPNVRGANYAAAAAHAPVTMVLRIPTPRVQLRGGNVNGALGFFPFSDVATVDIGGEPIPLESEPSVALAETLEASKFWERELGVFLGQMVGQKAESQLTVLEPFKRHRIPVVFVHGTGSSSARWADMVNDLLADPRIHADFHFWFFDYDSGNPIAYSASKLRSQLTDLVNFADPTSTDKCVRQAVVIGHSQGGLLTKMTVIDSGDAFWRNVTDTPFDEVKLSEEQHELIKNALFVEPLPFVNRVIFIATPQRGSYLAGPQFVRRFLQRLITLPVDVLQIGAGLTAALVGTGTTKTTLNMQKLPTSIDNMSPSHPFIRTISEIPIAPDVHVHSIIPVKGGGDPLLGNDGVVRYSSAHIDGVESELVVRSAHSTQGNPNTVEEVRRILLEHASVTGCADAPERADEPRPVPLSRVPQSGEADRP